MKYLYHHLGLGDHIICNGMVRHFYKMFGSLGIFCKHTNYNNVKAMYSDLPNLNIITVHEDSEADYIMHNEGIAQDTKKVGFNLLSNYIPPHTFDVAFYIIAGLDFQVRFDDFYLPRNIDREIEVYNELNPNNEPYIFVHDDKSRGFSIDTNKLPSNIKIIENDIKYGLFDMLTIIERAEEVHVMQSSLKDLINSFKFDKPKFFLHNYVRGYGDDANSIGLNKFEIIN
jgi:hypothetical protein